MKSGVNDKMSELKHTDETLQTSSSMASDIKFVSASGFNR